MGMHIDKAREYARFYKDVFGEDFYIEIQDHGLEDQKKVNLKLIELARTMNLKLVATNDVHYVEKEDALIQDVLACIQTGKKLSDENHLEFKTEEFYLKTEEEMLKIFSASFEAVPRP